MDTVWQEAAEDERLPFGNLLVCPDQDILNHMFRNHVKILPKSFNDQHHLDEQGSAGSLIVHYIWMKPWDVRYTGKLGVLYWENARNAGRRFSYIKYRARRFVYLAKTEYVPALRRKFGRKHQS